MKILRCIVLVLATCLTSAYAFSQNAISQYQYWFNSDFGNAVVVQQEFAKNVDIAPKIDASSLTEGLHVLNIRFQDKNGVWSAVKSQFFLKPTPKIAKENAMSVCQYWIDYDFANAVTTETANAQDIVLDTKLNFETIGEGLHVLNIRFQDKNGVWSAVKSQFFLKPVQKVAKENAMSVCQYWIDYDFANAVTTETANAKDIVLDTKLNFETIGEGLHVLNIRFQDKNGVWTSTKSQFFAKKAYRNQTEDGNIVTYQYWFDDNFVDAQTMVLESAGKNVDIADKLDCRRIPKGVHYLNFRSMDNRGVWSSVITDTIEKISLPIADFTFDTLEITCKSITLRFKDNSIDGDAYQWNFGDATDVDTSRNPTHTFGEGEFFVSLMVSDTTLNSDSAKAAPLTFEEERLYEELSETACESFVWNGETFTESNDYERTFLTENGCDSVVTLHLTINKSVENHIEEQACESFVWGSEEYTLSGDYTQTLQTVTGCDSTVTLHLTINHATVSDFSETSSQPFVWNGVTYNESGDYVQTLETQTGCDSVVTLHLTIQTGIENVNVSKIVMYPIPAKDYLNIESSEMINHIEIVNAAGQVVNRYSVMGTKAKCDVSSLLNGVYSVKMYLNNVPVPIQKTFVK